MRAHEEPMNATQGKKESIHIRGCLSRHEVYSAILKLFHDTPKKDAWSSSLRGYCPDLSRDESYPFLVSQSCFQSAPISITTAEQTYLPLTRQCLDPHKFCS